MGELPTRLGKGLGTGAADEIGLVRQMGEEGMQLVLHARLEAADHGDQQNREGQGSLAEEGVGLKPRRPEQVVGMEVVNKVDENALVLRSTWRLTFNINNLRELFYQKSSCLGGRFLKLRGLRPSAPGNS